MPRNAIELIGPALLFAAYIFLFVIERRFPLRSLAIPRSKRFMVNAVITILSLAIAGLVVRPATLRLAQWNEANVVGAVGLLPSTVVKAIAGILLLDLTFYYWHRLNHEWPLLWRFHNVHHVDPEMDVSTSFRFHPVETFYSVAFRAVQVGLIGVTPGVFLLYELLFQSGTLFHHSNVRLPLRLERILNKIIVTPRMHGIHHSVVRDESNSNYGTVFSWWDSLHRSLHLNIRQTSVTIGVAAYRTARDNDILRLITLPFQKQRDYAYHPDGTRAVRDSSDREGPPSHLAP